MISNEGKDEKIRKGIYIGSKQHKPYDLLTNAGISRKSPATNVVLASSLLHTVSE